MNNTSAWKNLKSTIAAPIDPWLFFAMLVIYIMSLFLLYSADGQEFGQLESKSRKRLPKSPCLFTLSAYYC